MALLLVLAYLLMWRLTLLAVNGEEHRYDYVVVGAGTAGMTIGKIPSLLVCTRVGYINQRIFLKYSISVAARISEDPKVQVAVVEAGDDYDRLPVNKRLVDTPGSDTQGCGANPCENVDKKSRSSCIPAHELTLERACS